MLEAEHLQHKELKTLYKRAAEMFELDDHSKSSCSKCRLKLAEYCSSDGEYEEAIRIFEAEGERSLESTMLQFQAKEHLLNAGILHLVMGDSVTVNISVERYQTLDPRFTNSREGELLASLAAAFEAEDVEAFSEHLRTYDSTTPLDSFRTGLLLKVKECMSPTTLQDDLDLT